VQVGAEIQDGWKLVLDPTDPGFHYEVLGRILRSNVVGGRSITYTRGVSQTDFNSSVFDRRQQRMEPRPTNPHNKQRDDLSKLFGLSFISLLGCHSLLLSFAFGNANDY